VAGPIGIAVASSIVRLTCPHCGTRQSRARRGPAIVRCKKCGKHFERQAAASAQRRRR